MAVLRGAGFMAALQQATKRSQELDYNGFSDTKVGGGPWIAKSWSPAPLRSLRPAKPQNDPVDCLPPGLEDELERQVLDGGGW